MEEVTYALEEFNSTVKRSKEALYEFREGREAREARIKSRKSCNPDFKDVQSLYIDGDRI